MIGSMRMSDLVERLNARLSGGDARFERVSTDTRSAQPGDLLVALKGERFDAHNFLDEAADKGVCGLVVEAQAPDIALPQLVVADSQVALGELAAANRDRFEGPLVAITGSCGKTTVKTMLAAILVRLGNVLATRGNYNNHIGVPLTLLELQAKHHFAVIEMGASGPGEIASYCRWARPDISLVNNVMAAHIKGFGSLEGVAKSKGEIYQGLQPRGLGVINLDEPYAPDWKALLGERKQLTFSLNKPEADCRARAVTHRSSGSDFILVTPIGEAQVKLQAPGEHQLRNALAAACCALALGQTPEAIARGLESFEPVAGRMSAQRGWGGAWIIDDSYNANPGSMLAAIEVLAAHPGQRFLVIGDMAELGEGAPVLHRQVGERARAKGIERLLTLGPLSAEAARAFGPGASQHESHQEVIDTLKGELGEASRVLIKGSRSAAMERVVQGLTDTGEQH